MTAPVMTPVSFTDTQTEDEIRGALYIFLPHALSKKHVFTLSISGYDDDERELWEIPSVISFLKKVISCGFMSCLAVSSENPELNIFQRKLPGIGALEVWMFANELMKKEVVSIDKETWENFKNDLLESNKVADRLMHEPPQKIKEMFFLKIG